MSLDSIIDHYLARVDASLWSSSDELAVIANDVQRGTTHHYQMKKITNDSYSFLQRASRLYSLLNSGNATKQLQTVENQLLQSYRRRLASVFQSLFSKMTNKLSPTELAIYKLCCQDDVSSAFSLFKCHLCNGALTLSINDLLFCSCSNEHAWPRCCRTLLPLPFECAQTCSLCERTITLIETDDRNYVNFVKYKDKELNFLFSTICTFCM